MKVRHLVNFLRRQAFFVAVVVAIIVGIFLGSPMVIGSGTEQRKVNEQDWSYTLKLSNGELQDIAIDYDFKNQGDVLRYVQAMKRENKALFASGTKQVVGAPIVFRRNLTWEEADAFVKKYQLTASDYKFRLVSKDDPNHRFEYSLGMSRDAKTNTGFGDWAQKSVQEQISTTWNGDVLFKGIIGMKANLDAEEYNKVISDPDVFLVDMPGVIVKAKLNSKSKAELQGFKVDANFDIPKSSPQLYRDIEDFGLEGK